MQQQSRADTNSNAFGCGDERFSSVVKRSRKPNTGASSLSGG